MNNSLVKQFNFLRVLGIVALICTILLSVILCIEALKPGDKSSETSGTVADAIKDNVNVNDNDQQYDLVSIRCNQAGMSRPVGETLKLTFVYTPKQATNKELTFSSSKPEVVSVSEEGVLTFHSYGEVKITTTSKTNPKVKTTFQILCTGIVANDITGIYPTFDVENVNAPAKYDIPAGTYGYIGFRNSDGEILSISTLDVVCNNEDVLRMDYLKAFAAVKPGVAKLTVTSKKSGQTQDITITVTPSDTFVPAERFEFSTDVLYVDKNTSFYPLQNISSVLPEGATFNTRFCSVKCLDRSLFSIANDKYTAVKLGETHFEITSFATGDVSRFKVVVVEPVPSALSILGNDRIVPDKSYSYTAFDGERECDNVAWSVVKGNASITADGKLVATKLGNVIIRATSTQDESILVELRVRVSRFESFGAFVRKIFGHFSAFALLGVGFAVSFFLLVRPRKLFPLFALCGGVFIAALTETFQLPIFTANRGPSVKDAFIDSAGALCGIAITTVVILIISRITKIVSPQKYHQTRQCLDALSFKTAFASAKKTQRLLLPVDDTTTTTVAEDND